MKDIFKKINLFSRIEEHDIFAMLKCLKSREEIYLKGNFIFLAEESPPLVGILLSGKANIIKESILGDSMIIGTLQSGDVFGETFACMEVNRIPVSVIALEKCEVILLDLKHIVNTCESACTYHRRLISNLLKIMAEKNIFLNRKMFYIIHKTIKSRLEAYFFDIMENTGSHNFTIPFNRNELADYLCVDRSAMCRELSKMKKEGIIEYKNRDFILLKF